MADIIIIAIIAVAVGAAVYYIYKAKKSGRTCIGCPHSKQCGKCGCHGMEDKDAKQ